MKKLFTYCCVILLFYSCHNYKKDAKQLLLERDSLAQEAALKDSSIVDYLNDFNQILTLLDSIKKVEKMVTIQSAKGAEMSSSQKRRILEDVDLLNLLIDKNKSQIAGLQTKLNQANYNIGDVNSTIEQMELMVHSMEKQLADKDTEVMALAKEVDKLVKSISILNDKITEIETENADKTNTIEKQTIDLNKAYYAYGTVKELLDSGIVERSGGFVGIGRSTMIKKDFNQEYFTEVDIRNFNFIPLMVKKAEIVSVHTAGSFHITGERTADTLFIDNKQEFWKASKYLVIITK